MNDSYGPSVAVLDLRTGETKVLISEASYPRFAHPGRLLFARHGVLYAAPFDLERLEVTGAAVPVLEGVAMASSPGWRSGTASGTAYYAVSDEGSLLFAPRDAELPRRHLLWVRRDGSRSSASSQSGFFRFPSLSPDGGRLAIMAGSHRGVADVVVLDFEKDVSMRATFLEEGEPTGVWMPDGDSLVVEQAGENGGRLLLLGSDFPRAPTVLRSGASYLHAVSPNGQTVLFCTQPTALGWDIWRLDIEGDREPEPFVVTPALEFLPAFSPDGRWVAYVSNESGPLGVWVRPFPGPGPPHLVSDRAAFAPRWSRDGKELFFVSNYSVAPKMTSARVREGPVFSTDPPEVLFAIPEDIDISMRSFDVSNDGRFLMVQKDPFEIRRLELVIVPEWKNELESRMSAAIARE